MKKLFTFSLGAIVIVSMVLATGLFTAPAKATGPILVTTWPVDVHPVPADPSLSAPIGITVIIGDSVWNVADPYTVTGSSATADFIVHFLKTVPGGIVPKVLVNQGSDAHCPEGYATGVDPEYPDVCAKADALTYHTECDQGCPTVVGFTDSRQVCPTEESAYTSHVWTPCGWRYGGFFGHWHYANYVTETYGPIDILYGCKSSDPNHCHRPDDGWNGQLGLKELFPGMPDWVYNDITSNKLNDHANPGITPEHLDKIDVNCHEVADPQTYSHQDMIPATDDVYECPSGSTENGEGQCQTPDGTTPVDVEYLLNLPLPTPKPYVEPKPIGLTLWIMKDYSLGFNISPQNIGPDGGCFVYGIGVIPGSPSEGIPYCDGGKFLGNDAYTKVYSGWVTLPYPGTQQCWGQKLDNGCEGDLKLAALNASTGWHLAYMWFFPGYGGH